MDMCKIITFSVVKTFSDLYLQMKQIEQYDVDKRQLMNKTN